MNKDTRHAIERATQRARKLLEEDFAAQLEGDFDVHRDGAVAAKAGGHLSARQAFQRERVIAAIEHKRAAGMIAADAARDYLRDAAFTTLNRFVALKMLEARDLVQECITKGEQSVGYREFCGMAPGLPLLPDSAGYRLYIESLFDELSTEVKVLFDRRDPSSVLWPKRATFEQLLEILNGTELAGVWSEDETIGWFYQFFNGQEERKKMRDESQAPRNSRELAVRNQFFTPRYVVQFLTDNTLGRIWYEMRDTKTALAEKCEYMVRKPGEEFTPRPKKDPRDLRVLDPACGSGHFLLYAFDLLLVMYEEAYADPQNPRSEATTKTLAEDYPSLDALRKAVPGLVLAHNLHGVDIDPRCAQIAQLALWMRAQRAYRDFDIGRTERAQIRRSNIIVAEPLVANKQITEDFVAKLGDAELGRVFSSLVELLNLAGDLGLLLRVEKLVAATRKQGELFAPPEERILAALARFVREEAGTMRTRQRLFADEAAHGLALLGIAEKRFDTVLMNPPFGALPERSQGVFDETYPEAAGNAYAGFLARPTLSPGGRLGALVSSTCLFYSSFSDLRRSVLLGRTPLRAIADLGGGVLDAATVKVAAIVVEQPLHSDGERELWVSRCVESADKERALRSACATGAFVTRTASLQGFRELPDATIAYWLPEPLQIALQRFPKLSDGFAVAARGCDTGDNFRFLRLWWEVPVATETTWKPYAKGGEFSPYLSGVDLVVNWTGEGHELRSIENAYLRNVHLQGCEGVSYPLRAAMPLNCWHLPQGTMFAGMSPAMIPQKMSLPTLLGWSNSYLVRFLVGLSLGGARTEPGTAANAYHVGILQQTPVAEALLGDATVPGLVERILTILRQIASRDETQVQFGSPVGLAGFSSASHAASWWSDAESELASLVTQIDERVEQAYDLSDEDRQWLHRSYESPSTSQNLGGQRPWTNSEVLTRLVSFTVGRAFGRWNARSDATIPVSTELVDDHLSRVVEEGLGEFGLVDEQARDEPLRNYLARGFFAHHLTMYRASGRTAPIYWQLATPSARYSIWLYIHAFSKDTFFRVQNDCAAPKLAHEERRLEALTGELREGATAAQRKQLAAQEAHVEELRAFLDEVKRVAPLWSPNLDDGVIINFAPLWRLVPQHKSWQKELKSTWDALCEGTYDWAHLAMHLWPERVVPKCAKDRSLAIAHGLEDVFWVEGTDGKWTMRKAPTHPVHEIVRERTSAAVKSAIDDLLSAPGSTTAAPRKGKRK